MNNIPCCCGQEERESSDSSKAVKVVKGEVACQVYVLHPV